MFLPGLANLYTKRQVDAPVFTTDKLGLALRGDESASYVLAQPLEHQDLESDKRPTF